MSATSEAVKTGGEKPSKAVRESQSENESWR